MTAPSSADRTNRASTISLRLSPDEAEKLREMSEAAGLSVSAFIRTSLFEERRAARRRAALPPAPGPQSFSRAAQAFTATYPAGTTYAPTATAETTNSRISF